MPQTCPRWCPRYAPDVAKHQNTAPLSRKSGLPAMSQRKWCICTMSWLHIYPTLLTADKGVKTPLPHHYTLPGEHGPHLTESFTSRQIKSHQIILDGPDEIIRDTTTCQGGSPQSLHERKYHRIDNDRTTAANKAAADTEACPHRSVLTMHQN